MKNLKFYHVLTVLIKTIPCLVFTILYFSIATNVMARGLFPERISNNYLISHSSTFVNKGDSYNLNDHFYYKNQGSLIHLFPIHYTDCKSISASLPDNEINENSSGWKLKKSTEDIFIYYRWVEFDLNKKTRHLLSDMIVNAPISSVVAIIKDETTAKRWIFCAKKFYHIDILDDTCWYSYTEFRSFWPLPNQDLILKNHLIADPQNQVITIETNSVPDYIPEKNGIKRFQHFRGIWKLTPIPDGRTSINYITFTNTKSNIPTWVTDPIVLNGLTMMMKKMRELILNYETDRLNL